VRLLDVFFAFQHGQMVLQGGTSEVRAQGTAWDRPPRCRDRRDPAASRHIVYNTVTGSHRTA
jgi:hypothetical protein